MLFKHLGGYSTTMWTKIYPYTPQVYKNGHFKICNITRCSITFIMRHPLDFQLTPHPPLLVYVVIEWPLTHVSFLTKSLATYRTRSNKMFEGHTGYNKIQSFCILKSAYYGNTGCRVYKWGWGGDGVQNWKLWLDFPSEFYQNVCRILIIKATAFDSQLGT